MNLENSLSQIGGKLRFLLPLLMMAVIMAAMVAYGITKLLPELRLNNTLNAQKEALEETLAEREADTEVNTFLTVLQSQIDETNDMMSETVNSGFLSKAQADALLDHLYAYASTSSVEIVNLQSQEIAQETNADIYGQSYYRIQVAGQVPPLMNFVSRIHELGLPSIYIQNFAIAANLESNNYLLNMDLQIQNSPIADGTALDALPQREIIAPTVAELILFPVASPTSVLPSDSAGMPPAQEVPASGLPNASSETSNTLPQCPDAIPTMFTIGDRVVVDFNGSGSLNILPRARQSSAEIMSALDVVKDNDTLLLLDGPVCGEWEGRKLWYWYVESDGVRGWAAEAVGNDRWLCPESNPECAE